MRGRVETLPLVFQYAKAKRLAPWAQGIVRRLGCMLVFENVEDFKEYIHKRGGNVDVYANMKVRKMTTNDETKELFQ